MHFWIAAVLLPLSKCRLSHQGVLVTQADTKSEEYDVHSMKRIQFYVQENMWKALHVRSRRQGISISELIRRAVIEKYGMSPISREEAMRAIVGIWKDRRDLPDSTTYVRRLRKAKRLRRMPF